jgi:hypothetical protein
LVVKYGLPNRRPKMADPLPTLFLILHHSISMHMWVPQPENYSSLAECQAETKRVGNGECVRYEPGREQSGKADSQNAAVSGKPVSDSDMVVALPVIVEVARQINQSGGITVTNPANGKSVKVYVADIGPNQAIFPSANSGIALSPAVGKALDMKGTDFAVQIRWDGDPSAFRPVQWNGLTSTATLGPMPLPKPRPASAP